MTVKEDEANVANIFGRIERAAWPELLAGLDERGYAVIPGLLSQRECRGVAALYEDATAFRSRVVMARHNFGRGEYKYLRYPLPPLVAELRDALYPALAPFANRWHERLRLKPRFPATLEAYLKRCHAAGQQRPTPLILKYEAGDYNCLHQDLYGELVFPIQATVLLSKPGEDFTGGEFLLVEQRPRAQSRGTSLVLGQGQALVFTTHVRPVRSSRGWSAAPVRHGVSMVRSGRRRTLGLVLHDAR